MPFSSRVVMPSIARVVVCAALLAAAALALAEPGLAQKSIDDVFKGVAKKGDEAIKSAVVIVRVVGIAMVFIIAIWGMMAGFRGTVLSKGIGIAIGLLLVGVAEPLVNWLYPGS